MLDLILFAFLHPATVAMPEDSKHLSEVPQRHVVSHYADATNPQASPSEPGPSPRSPAQRPHDAFVLFETNVPIPEPELSGVESFDGRLQLPHCESQCLMRTRSQRACVHSGVPP